MTLIEFVAGMLIAVIVGLIYYLTLFITENEELKKHLDNKIELLTSAALELEHVKRKLEKINELTR
mgnify:FL=1